MTDNNIDTKIDVTGRTPEQSPGLPLVVHAQYVKDISFENPTAPNSLRSGLSAPKMDLSINLDAQKIEDDNIKNLFEVSLHLTARALRDGQPVFIADVLYGVAVSLQDTVPEDQQHPMLMIEVPRLAFPFARQILSDLTQSGGYPALLLGPVDFFNMYMARFGNKEAAG